MPRRNLSLLLPQPAPPLSADPIISGVTEDPRAVAPGMLYAGMANSDIDDAFKYDGREYITQAIADGAAAILVERGSTLPPTGNVPVLAVENARRTFAQIVGAFYAEQPSMLAAVTGTNGKTSVSHFTRDLWAQSGRRAACIGTLGIIAPHLRQPSGGNTTPDAVSLHRTLAMLVENNVTHCILEASSHALHQHRPDGTRIKVAAFTNFTRDHLDYHGTMEDYRTAKLRLFTEILPVNGTAVLNADMPDFPFIQNDITHTHRTIMTFGNAGADLQLRDVKRMGYGQRLTINAGGSDYVVDLPLIGGFQVENALCAAAIVIAGGEPVSTTLANLSNLAPVRGRMELVGATADSCAVYVDYAHTPDALQNMLKTLRPHTTGKLHVVFGCGGDRDGGKRPQMGAIANDLADVVVVTDDNPRTENAAAIRAAILAACPKGRDVPNRATAIQEAVAALRRGDVLVIAGKGHEQGQKIGADVIPFDDAEVARFALDMSTPPAATTLSGIA